MEQISLKAAPEKTKILKSPTRPPAAFTLLETVVVITIIGVITGLAVPYFSKAVQQQQFKTTAQELRRALETAHQLSINENSTVAIAFNTTEATYSFGQRTYHLPGNISFSLEGNDDTINFYQDGSADQRTLVLRNDTHKLMIRIDPLTGLARVEP